MKISPFAKIPALVACATLPVSVAATAAESPEGTLNRGLAELLALAKGHSNRDAVELARRLRPTLERLFNFESLTRKALGAGWKDLSPSQKTKAVALFSEIIIRSYTSKFDPNSQIEVQFSKAIELGEGRKEMPATARYQGTSVAVAYRVENGPQGWRVYDVIIEGVSLASNYRAQFDSIRQKGGPEALLHSMEEKLK